jgi:putative sterol carrier protein
VARFLSNEWFEEVNRLAPPVPGDLNVVIEQHVANGPDGDVDYQVSLRSGHLSAGPPADSPDVVLLLDYATAAALATGRLTAHDAFLTGRIRLRGGVSQLERAAAALGALGDSLATLARSTTY